MINSALLSFGLSGRVFHAPFLHLHTGFHLKGCWERSKSLFHEAYPDSITYRSLQEVLEDNAIDLVIVNTPVDTHFDYAMQALKAGKHVVVEKAFTTTVEEARALKAEADAAGKKLAVYQNRRWDSDFMTVRKVVSEGQLGHIHDAAIHFDRYKPAIGPKAHKEAPGPGAGLLKDLGPHIIDQALVLFGLPERVFAVLRTNRPDSQVDDFVEITLLYPDKTVRLKSSLLVAEQLPAFIIHGAEGSFVKTRADVQEALLMAAQHPIGDDWGREPDIESGWLHTVHNGIGERRKVETLPGNYMAFYEGVYKAITNNQPMPVTPDDGIAVMRIIEAAAESNATGRVVNL